MLERSRGGQEVYDRWEQCDKELQKEERGVRIRWTRYNRWYKEIGVEVPAYLWKRWGGEGGGE